MKIIKLFTMVKDEIDIVEDWLIYHGSLFGFENLYIIDNCSSDGTYKLLKKYQIKKNINLTQEKYYQKKGEYIQSMINKLKDKYDIAYPLDIDEFIIYYDKKKNIIDPTMIVKYINSLPNKNLYKTNYIISLIDMSNSYGYKYAARESLYGKYQDYGEMAKSFFTNKWKGKLDHGNHCYINDYYLTDLCLVHYHDRNKDQIMKKIINNVNGLGYKVNNLNYLKKLDNNCCGNHHVKRLINILEGKPILVTNIPKNKKANGTSLISLKPICDYLILRKEKYI